MYGPRDLYMSREAIKKDECCIVSHRERRDEYKLIRGKLRVKILHPRNFGYIPVVSTVTFSLMT